MINHRPNILIIQADQHRIDCLGAYGNPDVKTPALDGLAADGVRYNNSFSPYPVCTPSRYSFLSSLYVRQHLAGSNHATLPAGLPTFPRELQKAGYQTQAVGKMHFTPTYLDVGFDQMLLAEQNGPGRYEDDYHRWLRSLGLVDAIDLLDQEREFRQNAPEAYWHSFGAMESNLDEDHHSTTWIGDRAVEAVENWGTQQSNLLMASFIKPHHPFDPPAPWSQMYHPDFLTLLPGWTDECLPQDLAYRRGYFSNEELNEAALRQVMAYYYATISQIDHHVGRLIEVLKARGLYEKTLILYNSDHGDYLGFHHLLLKGNYMYDPLIKVPLIVKYPAQSQAAQAKAGTVSQKLVNSTDIAPTLLALAGCAIPETFCGINLLDESQTRDVIFAEAGRGAEYMVRTHSHKLLLCPTPEQSQFFDLERDPLEMENRYTAPAYQKTIEALRQRLLHWTLFEQPSPVHVNEEATVLPTAPTFIQNEFQRTHARNEAQAYFRSKMG
ncbi:MAG: sulfatase-like hydrolase/transferase [Chloroflexota bacterium]